MKNRRLNVVIEATALSEGAGGTVTYLNGLIQGWKETAAALRLTLVGTQSLAQVLRDQEGADCRVVRMWSPSAAHRTALQQLVIPMLALTCRADLIFGAVQISPLLPSFVPTVVTVHDLRYLRRPEDLGRIKRLYRATMYEMSIKRATRVIADSQRTLSDVLKIVPKAGSKTTVIPPGAGHVRKWSQKASESDYAIAFAHQAYKHPEIAIRAWGKLRARLPGLTKRLVIVGVGVHYGRGGLRAEAGRAGVSDLVDVLPYVPEEELRAIFSGASLLLFPSSFEGYGFPVAEAMALGIPVVCSNDDALVEVGSDCVLYADVGSSDAFAEQCARLIQDGALRRALANAGLERMSTFTWARTAEATLKVFREAAGSCPAPGQV